tara:strand:- start:2464 stop:3813 length:1350 start_codon:yes stop_codon:yes gene_type:complete
MPENNVSLQEYISQAQRGYFSGIFGPDFLQKQSYFTVDTATGIFNTTYGNRVWHALNNQTRIFNALPRTVWGKTAGWRVRTDRGSGRSRPVTETGTIPTVDISNITNVSSLPRIVGTTFGASVKAIFTSQLEGGVGDVLAMELENSQIDHVKEINEELLAGSAYLTSDGTTTSFTVPAAVAGHFKIGDAVSMDDATAGDFDRITGSVVSAVNTSTGVVTVASDTTFANGDIAFIYSRAGFTSLDDIIWEDTTTTSGPGGGAAQVRAYDLTYSGRTAGTWNAGALVSQASGVGRDLSFTLLDNGIQNIRQNGGEPKLMVLGHDQYFRLERLLNTQQRYMGVEEYQVGVGNERTFPGTRTGMVLATYQGIPILTDPDCPASVATDDSVIGRNVYILDTDYLEIAIAQPTQYVENRDYFAANALVVRGLFYTMGELRCRNIWTQAAIRDLNA